MIDFLVPVFLIGYAVLIAVVCFGMFRLKARDKRAKTPDDLPSVSVIVACKNEEQDLPLCIESLIKLDYPSDKLEIILVDDDSSDSTAEVILSYAEKCTFIKYLNTKDYQTSLRAKARGIALGAENATGEWMFITDADAIVPSAWLKEMLRGADTNTGLIGAMLTVDDDSIVGILEKMTWGYTLPYAFGAAGLGSSFICVGPNMGVRKDLYDQSGGLENIKFKIAEDLAIFVLVTKAGGKVLSHASEDTTLRMKPVPSLTHLFSQHRRWLRGPFEHGKEYGPGVAGAFFLAFAFSIVLLLAFTKSFMFGIAALGIKALIDFALFATEKYHTKQKAFLRYSFIGSLYITITMIWLPISLIFNSSITWKGDGYIVKYN